MLIEEAEKKNYGIRYDRFTDFIDETDLVSTAIGNQLINFTIFNSRNDDDFCQNDEVHFRVSWWVDYDDCVDEEYGGMVVITTACIDAEIDVIVTRNGEKVIFDNAVFLSFHHSIKHEAVDASKAGYVYNCLFDYGELYNNIPELGGVNINKNFIANCFFKRTPDVCSEPDKIYTFVDIDDRYKRHELVTFQQLSYIDVVVPEYISSQGGNTLLIDAQGSIYRIDQLIPGVFDRYVIDWKIFEMSNKKKYNVTCIIRAGIDHQEPVEVYLTFKWLHKQNVIQDCELFNGDTLCFGEDFSLIEFVSGLLFEVYPKVGKYIPVVSNY